MRGQRVVLATLAAAGMLVWAPGSAVAKSADVEAISADPVDSGSCGPAGKWRFTITGVIGIAAPSSISATVAGGSATTIDLTDVSEYGFAYYEITTAATLTGQATTQIDTGWNNQTGNFFLDSGPCIATAMAMSANTPLVILGGTFNVSGRLTSATNAPLANRSVAVVLHSIDADGKGLDVGNFTTNADGRFTAAIEAESPGLITLTGMYLGEAAAGGGEESVYDSTHVWSLPAVFPTIVGALASSSGASIHGGDKTVVSGSGFAPESEIAVVIYSSPHLLATFNADSSGAFSGEVTIPGAYSGEHKLVAAGLDAQGESIRYLGTTVTVTATGQGGGLPLTGASVRTLITVGVVLIVAGFVTVHWARRRRPA